MIPGGVMCAPTLSDVTRSIAILDYWKREWLEKQWLGCSIERWLEIKTWNEMLAWADENESQHNSDCALFIRFAQAIGLDKYGRVYGNYLATGTFFEPTSTTTPRSTAATTRSSRAPASTPTASFHEFDHLRVTRGRHALVLQGRQARCTRGRARPIPIDPLEGHKQGKYTWAKSPRYDVPGRARCRSRWDRWRVR
jgi:hypothetical protein